MPSLLKKYSVIAPPPRLKPSEWAEANFYLSPESSSEPGRISLERAPYQREMLDAIDDPAIEEVCIMSSSQVGKALDIATPIPTVDGWKTMEEIAVGDRIFDEKGNACNVVALSEIQVDRNCYAVTFSDNSVIVADADHRWTVDEYSLSALIGKPTLTTYQMSLNFKRGNRNRYAIPVASPLNLADKELLVNPYLLGVWLGDGHSNRGVITCHKDDFPYYQEAFVKEGYKVVCRPENRNKNVVSLLVDPKEVRDTCVRGHSLPNGGICPQCAKIWYTNSNMKVAGKDPTMQQPPPAIFSRQLIAIGVMSLADSSKKKSIPPQYLRASYQQRIDLLCGLMDTDGCIDPANGRCEFVTTKKELAEGFGELLASLGIKFTRKEKYPVTTYKGKRVNGKKAYRFSFLVYSDTPVFRLPRKLKYIPGREGRRTTETEKRRIVDISPVETRPVKCIAVDSPSHLYLAGKTMIPTHNTSVQLMVAGFMIDVNPGPILWVAPTLQMAEATSKDRLAPMFRDCPCFADKIKSPQSRNSGNTLLQKAFPGGFIVLAGANSPSSLASRPIQALIGDEIDRYPDSAGTEGNPINLAKKRTTTFWNRLHIWVSTPTVKDRSNIESIWLESDRRHYLLPCPHCGEYQQLVWDSLWYENKGKIDLSRSDVGEVFYQCGGCGKNIEEHHKSDMLRRGRWEKTGKVGKIAGFHLNELYSPWKAWSDVARDFEAAQGDPLKMQVFWNTSLGLPFEHDNATKFDWENLQWRSESSDYQMGQIPEGALLLTAGVDVQGDRLECSVFGWGEGEQAWLIRHDVLYGDPLDNGVWEDLEALITNDFHHPLGGTIRVKKMAIDSGYLAQEVYRRSRGKRDWMVVKGMAGDRKLVSPGTWQEINWQGKPVKRGIKLFVLGVDLIKQALLGRCRVSAPGPKYLNLPQNLPQRYAQELAGSEVMVKKKLGGTWRYVWEPIPGVRNEPLDCAVYAYAAAVFLGLPRFNSSHWAKLKAPLATNGEANLDSKTANLDSNTSDSPDKPKNLGSSTPDSPDKPKPKRRQRPRSNYLSGYSGY